jgi:hypothetical protein
MGFPPIGATLARFGLSPVGSRPPPILRHNTRPAQ